MHRPPPSIFQDQYQPDMAANRAPPPGRQALLLAALTIGFLLLAIQLWLLTVALDLYLGGSGDDVWQLALASGVVFLGGLVALRLLDRRPRVGD
ncbi:MAG: DUF6755 family protein [Dehalococcoidia bacterium]